MNNISRKIVNGLSLILTVLALSACVTNQLKSAIRSDENGRTLHNSDVITAATITEAGKGNYRWVFIGSNFDYALTSGASDFFRALVTGKIDKARIRVSEESEFTLNKEKNQFNGEIVLKYSYRDLAERMFIMNDLNLPVWNCSGAYGDAGECKIRLTNLAGTIHKKSPVPDDVFRFNHPIKVKFYTRDTLSAKRLLYPAAVATDVVMSPLYLLSGVAVLTFYGIILLH